MNALHENWFWRRLEAKPTKAELGQPGRHDVEPNLFRPALQPCP